MNWHRLALPLLLALPAAGCLLLAVLPAALGDRLARPVALAATGGALLVALGVAAGFDLGRVPQSGTALDSQYDLDLRWAPALDARFHLGVDGISLPLVVLTALLTFLCAVYTVRVLPAPGRPRALLALVLLLEVGVLGSFVALDLLLFFAFFEVVLVPMYFVIAVWGGEGRGPSALTFLLYTFLGSAFLLVAILAVYARSIPHTFDIVALSAAGGAGLSHTVQVLAFGGMFVAFAVKAPLWPFHTWLPDAHTAAPTIGSVLLAGVLLKLGTYGLIRIGLPVLPAGARAFAPLLGVLSVVAIVYGSLCCLRQTDLKRLIAFSSVGHMGFVLLGIATLSPVGVNAALFGNIAHGLITGLLFFLVGSVKERFGTTDIRQLGGGLAAKAPYLGGLLTATAIASLGLPGLAGFWGEMLALLGAFRPGAGLSGGLFRTLMVVGGVGTVLTAAYFLVMLQRVTFGVVTPRWRAVAVRDVRAVELLAWTPLLVLTGVLGLYPRLLLGVTDVAVRALLAGVGR